MAAAKEAAEAADAAKSSFIATGKGPDVSYRLELLFGFLDWGI
jgi:hypothetical protein